MADKEQNPSENFSNDDLWGTNSKKNNTKVVESKLNIKKQLNQNNKGLKYLTNKKIYPINFNFREGINNLEFKTHRKPNQTIQLRQNVPSTNPEDYLQDIGNLYTYLYDVFLGGSANPTTWRKDIVIPLLEKNNVTYYNPQVDDWKPELIALEAEAKERSKIILIVLDDMTSGVVSMMESLYYAPQAYNLVPPKTVMVVRPTLKEEYKYLNKKIEKVKELVSSDYLSSLQELQRIIAPMQFVKDVQINKINELVELPEYDFSQQIKKIETYSEQIVLLRSALKQLQDIKLQYVALSNVDPELVKIKNVVADIANSFADSDVPHITRKMPVNEQLQNVVDATQQPIVESPRDSYENKLESLNTFEIYFNRSIGKYPKSIQSQNTNFVKANQLNQIQLSESESNNIFYRILILLLKCSFYLGLKYETGVIETLHEINKHKADVLLINDPMKRKDIARGYAYLNDFLKEQGYEDTTYGSRIVKLTKRDEIEKELDGLKNVAGINVSKQQNELMQEKLLFEEEVAKAYAELNAKFGSKGKEFESKLKNLESLQARKAQYNNLMSRKSMTKQNYNSNITNFRNTLSKLK